MSSERRMADGGRCGPEQSRARFATRYPFDAANSFDSLLILHHPPSAVRHSLFSAPRR